MFLRFLTYTQEHTMKHSQFEQKSQRKYDLQCHL